MAMANVVLLVVLAGVAALAAGTEPSTPYAGWPHGPSTDPGYFPIAVWLQDPENARRYREIGVNVYVGLYRGPTERQLATLHEAGMQVICYQNQIGLAHHDDPTIIGWMHGDEPDNAQSRGRGQGYGPPILPEKIIADYEAIKRRDPSRPVLLNLGQGVAWDGWHGRGVRTNHPEDYAEYVRGCDIASFDIYPVCHRSPEIAGKLWYVPFGVERLRGWAAPSQVVWDCIETTRISSDRKATPRQVRSEVWMSIIHGSMGIIYFAHEFSPRFTEDALLDDEEMRLGVAAINREIRDLAPVLNSPTVEGRCTASSSNPAVPVAVMLKEWGGALYLFAAAMRDGSARATFSLTGMAGPAEASAYGEQRTLPLRGGTVEDDFGPYDVRIYRILPGDGS
jgi:hypothetical protein